MSHLVTIGDLSSTAVQDPVATTHTMNDDVLFRWGTDGDIVSLNKSALNAADAEITSVIVGTSDHQGTAANSLIISNITASGDVQGLVNNGGNSLEWLLVDASVPSWHLGYGLTGDGSVYVGTGNSFDVYINKVKEIDYATGALAFQQATTISTTATTLTLTPATDVHITDTHGFVVGHTAQLTAAGIVSEAQVIGTDYADGSLGILLYSATANRGAILNIGHGLNATIGTNSTKMASDDALGYIQFLGSDGAALSVAASIEGYADAAWSSAADRPTRLVFKTTPDGSGTNTERLRITNAGVITTLVAAPANVTALGAGIFQGGIAMTDVANAHIDDATHGTGTVTHYIGNAAILTGNGVSFGPAAVASITVVNGQITAIS